MFANGVPLDEIKRCGRWVSDTLRIYVYGDSLNLRDLSYALCDDNHLLDQIRAANEHRVTRMPERRKIRKIDRAQGEFSHCVWGRCVKLEEEYSDVTPMSTEGYPQTRADTAFDEVLLRGAVGPKLESDTEGRVGVKVESSRVAQTKKRRRRSANRRRLLRGRR